MAPRPTYTRTAIVLHWLLALALFALFALGIYGLVTRRNAVGVLASVELMANAVNINLVAFSRYLAVNTGQVFALFTTAITVAVPCAALEAVTSWRIRR